MTTQSIVHSNAFNFLSFVQGGVDPRTGQYTLAIQLPELPANDLNGPSLPLRLSYNPMSKGDPGFGDGWSLNLSQFTNRGMLNLHSGESFKVDDNGPGEQAVVLERKIDSFHFENVSEGEQTRYRVAHKTGLIELLEPQAPNYTVSLPVRVLAETGHGITLGYTPVDGAPCLEWIVDDTNRTLLKIDYSTSDVLIDLNPGTKAFARYTLVRDGDELKQVVLPTPDKARWEFDYHPLQTESWGILRLLTHVRTPLGGSEVIEYKYDGHDLPGGKTLPYVTRHVVSPGFEQEDVETHYAFSSNNYLGNGAGVDWEDNGFDNLYKFTGSDFLYTSTTSHYMNKVAVRVVERSFNRFHLITKQVTTQDTCVNTVTTTYHEVDNLGFSAQPNNFQLPKTVTTAWRLAGNSNAYREQTVTTDYDPYGNLILERQPNGVTTHSTYYPAAAEGDYPGDPEGFVRWLRSRTVEPAADGDAGAETLRSDYTYVKLSALDADARGKLLQHTEALVRVQGAKLLRHTQTEYADSVGGTWHRGLVRGRQIKALRHGQSRLATPRDDKLQHGRPVSETLKLNGKVTHTTYNYTRVEEDQHPVVQTVATLNGFDHGHYLPGTGKRHAQKVTTLRHSVLIGEPLLHYDENYESNDVQIAYTYDELRRVTSETVAPGTEYTAKREYSYHLSSNGSQALQVMVDVKGVTTWSYVDGLNREVRRMRQDPDYALTPAAQEAQRQTYSATYDALGNLVEEVEHEWLALEDLPLTTRYEYDAWGQRCCEVGPDGVRNHEQTDPIGTQESAGPIITQWRESGDGKVRTGKTVTWQNLFDKPVRVERLRLDGKRESLHQYFYDGLGRTSREIDGRQAQTAFAYDEFDRLLVHTLADNSQVVREYAPHSHEDLPVLIKVLETVSGVVEEHVLGEQAFDGLNRMVASVTGGRRRLMEYAPGMRQPESVISPRGEHIVYKYVPQVGEEPWQRTLVNTEVNAEYDYDTKNARLLGCKENGDELSRDYYSTGHLRSETRSQGGGEPLRMQYVHSLGGRLLSYTDVLGGVQSHRYNALGQLEETRLGTLVSRFYYDALGRIESYVTETEEPDGSVRSLTTTLGYDEFERETSRIFDFGDTQQTLTQTYDAVDAIVTKTLSEGEGTPVLREESYVYDERGRLTDYECQGEDAYVPVDPYGNKIQLQRFDMDALDNITRVRTLFEEGMIDARYHFDNPWDPAQLTGITINGLEDEPRIIELEYDADGNLILDEEGRQLEYDGLGRLQRVKLASGSGGATYGYDALDRLAMQDVL
ncbi:sugar-binding protein [Pseudomonas sp. FW305-E2]|uniref:RHS repeat domain-containing protein n=1 Tax=Pseudomonas sp. FW305-E2 TaxID=2075558 RepID=UPI000B4EB080|nr:MULTISPECIES: RHS repeat protein [Pseudomonas]POA82862.1 sugar-binding protein [Pseudomonas sp. FW305-E2]